MHYGTRRLTAEGELVPGKHDRENWMDPAVVSLQAEKAGVFFPFSQEITFGVILSVCSQVLLTCLNASPVICDYTNMDSANTKHKQLQNKPTGCSEIPMPLPTSGHHKLSLPHNFTSFTLIALFNTHCLRKHFSHGIT